MIKEKITYIVATEIQNNHFNTMCPLISFSQCSHHKVLISIKEFVEKQLHNWNANGTIWEY